MIFIMQNLEIFTQDFCQAVTVGNALQNNFKSMAVGELLQINIVFDEVTQQFNIVIFLFNTTANLVLLQQFSQVFFPDALIFTTFRLGL